MSVFIAVKLYFSVHPKQLLLSISEVLKTYDATTITSDI